MSRPQALPSLGSGSSFVMSQTTATGVKNVFSDPQLHLQVLYSSAETPFKSNLACPSGIAGVNSECLCVNSLAAVPYRQNVPSIQSAYMTGLFSPIEIFPQLSRAAMQLVQERSPYPNAYKAMDGVSLANPHYQ